MREKKGVRCREGRKVLREKGRKEEKYQMNVSHA